MGKTRGKEFALDFLADVAGGFIQAVALHCFADFRSARSWSFLIFIL